MRLKPKLIGATAALSAGLLVLAGCQGETGSLNDNDDDNAGDNETSEEEDQDQVEDIPGLPSSEIMDWEGACDTLNVDEAFDFFGVDDWKDQSPLDLPVGEGGLYPALSCDGSANWPMFTFPSDRETTPDGNFRILLIPLTPDPEAADPTDEWLRGAEDHHQRHDNFSNYELEGPWDRGHFLGSEADYSDVFSFQFADLDFMVEGIFQIPDDPADGNPDSFELHGEDPEDWVHFDFDSESAEHFLVEEYLPGVYHDIMDGLER